MGKRNSITKRTIFIVLAILLLGCASWGTAVWIHRAHKTNVFQKFDETVTSADKIVFLDIERTESTLLTLTDPAEIAEFRTLWEFAPAQEWEVCDCAGFPGIEWHRGGKILAQMSFHHGRSLRWDAFPGDAELTLASRQRASRWFLEHFRGTESAQYSFKEWEKVASDPR